MTRIQRSLLLLTGLAGLGCLIAGTAAAEGDVQYVEVVNLPEVQTVEGRVSVAGPIHQTKLLRLSEEVVSPVGPENATSMELAGTLESAGFGSVVLSLAGSVRAAFHKPGQVGAILIPDVEPARTAFLEEGQLLFPLRVEAGADSANGAYFSSDQPQFRVGFDRYRVYFYNTTDRPASVTLFAYLGN